MHIFYVTFQSVAALLLIGVLGFFIVKRQIIPENVLRFLAILAIDIALPCIVFANIILQFSPTTSTRWWQYPLWWLLFSAIAITLTVIFMWISHKSTRREFAISLFFQNGMFFPLIIITGLFGQTNPYIAILFIFVAFHPSLYYSTNYLFFKKPAAANPAEVSPVKPARRLRLGRIVNPVLISTLLAMLIKLVGGGGYIPEFVITVLQLLGNMSLPLVMFILGGSLYLDFQNRGQIYYKEIIKFVLIKNFVFPLAFIGVALLIRPAYPVAMIMLLESAVPPITGIPIDAERYGVNRAITHQFILASFLLSIISVPVMFNFFSRFFPIP
jgi:malate permease and related proteins